MQIKLKLMGRLRSQAPPEDILDLPDGSAIADLLNALDLDEKDVQVVSVDNQFVHDRKQILLAGQQVTLLPPVVGG